MGITPKDPADFDPSMGDYKDLRPFRFWCQKVLPLVYDDSLSYYEVLCKLVDYLNKTMEDVGVLHEDVDALHTAYQQLQAYVNDYFSTLDVQQEINNKLDIMASDGTLDALLLPYFNAYKTEINGIVAQFETDVNSDITAFKNTVNGTLGQQNQIISNQNDNISTLSSRVDAIASLTPGSTTGDAELIDIRVGANGLTYPSAGDAVRSQVIDLRDFINFSNSNLSKAISEALYNTSVKSISYTTNDYKLLDSGRVASDSSYNINKYVVTPGDVIIVNSVHKFQFQNNESGSTTSDSYRVGTTYDVGTFICEVPSGATYLLVSTPTTGTQSVVYSTTSSMNDLCVDGDGVVYPSAGDAVRAQVADLRNFINFSNGTLSKALSDDLYNKTLRSVSYSAENYRLLDNGRVAVDNTYQINKYSVVGGTTLIVVSDHKFQFQSHDAASTTHANNRVGSTYGSGVFVVDVPETATFLYVSTPKVGSTSAVYIGESISSSNTNKLTSLSNDYDKDVNAFKKTINLYNGTDFIYGGWSSSPFTLDGSHNKITAVIKCEPNTQYWIVRNTATDNFGRVGTTTEYPKSGSIVTDVADLGGVLAWSVTTGADAEYLLFYYTYTALNEFIQITDYEKTTLNQLTYPVLSDAVYNKSQVNALLPQAETKKCKISKTGDKLDIYMPSPSSNNFIHFSYELVYDVTTNFNQWKVMDTDVCDGSLSVIFNLYASSNNVEWEGVVRESGASDFIGGYHGDEVNVSLSVMIDGKPLDMSNDLTVTECDEIFIVNKSIVNSCNDPTNQLFTRYKVSTWNKDKYTIRNRWIALKNNIDLDIVYMTMFSLPIVKGDYTIATSGRYDDGYVAQDPREAAVSGSCLYPSHYAKTVEFWGDDFYGRCKAIYDSYTNYTCICDRSQANIFKGYWKQHNNGVIMNTNDELNGLSEYEFFC